MNPVQFANSTDYIETGAFSADLYGDSIDAGAFKSVAMTVINNGTNTPVGNLYIQASDDNSTFVNATAAIAVSGAENNLLEITNLTNRYVRFYWDWASAGASSTVNVMYTLKS